VFLTPNKTIYPVACLKLPRGFRGIAALTDSKGNVFSKEDWATCLAEPEGLEHNPGEVLKRDGSDSVIVKTIRIGTCQIKVVIKTRLDTGYNAFFMKYLRAARSLRNFRMALKLKNAGVSAEVPLVALWQKEKLFSAKTTLITEYISQNASFDWFVKRDLPKISNQPSIKKNLAQQLAVLFADLHNSGLWHRDAKPSNILVHWDDDGHYKLMLIDLDGIKPYHGLQTFNRRFRPFGHLAALRVISPLVYTTDCLRAFNIYCDVTGVDKAERKQLFGRIANGPVAKRLKRLALMRYY
jgi:tRNA A-37 threonylcarbamoyl transferase component Bud32